MFAKMLHNDKDIFLCFEYDIEILTRLPTDMGAVTCHSLNRGVVPLTIYSGDIIKLYVTPRA